MTGWYAGDRILSPIGYAPYGYETYTYGDETVRYETGVWFYLGAEGEIVRAYGYEERPWLANWPSPYTAEKVRQDGTACNPPTSTPTETPTPTPTPTSTIPPREAGFVVNGAGSSAFNGTYCPDGILNGKTRYKLAGTNYTIEYTNNWVVNDEENYGPTWLIQAGNSNWTFTQYYNISSSDTPPLSGWGQFGSSSSPAPTLSSTVCSLTPTPTPTPTVTISPTFDTTLVIASGDNSVSGNGVTLSGAAGSSISFNQTSPINNPLSFTDIRIYIGGVYSYRITTYSEVITANNTFVLVTNTGNAYTSSFGAGTNAGPYRRIDF